MSKFYSILIVILLGTSIPGISQEVTLDWAGQFGGAKYTFAFGMALSSAGEALITGSFEETVDFDPGPGTFNLTSGGKSDIFVVKLDANQQFLWARHFSGPGSDRGWALTVSEDGAVYITGEFAETMDFDPGSGVFQMTAIFPYSSFVTKLDPDGNFLWAKQLQSTVSNHSGAAIAMDPSGDVVFTGFFDGATDFDPGPGTFTMTAVGGSYSFVCRLSPDGEFRWAKSFGGNGNAVAKDLIIDQTGYIYFCGYYNVTADFDPGTGVLNLTSAGNSDAYIVKLDNSGNLVWAKSFGGTYGDYINAIVIDQSGAISCTGYFSGTADFDPGPGVTNLVAEYNNIFLLKLSNNGDLAWARVLTGNRADYGKSIACDPQGRIYVTGCIKGTTDFDPGPSTTNLTSKGDFDFFLSKYDTGGNLIRVNQLSGAGNDCGNKIIVDPAGNIFAAGYFGGTSEFNPSGTGNALTATGTTDAFLVKLLQETSGTEEIVKTSDWCIYPNPTQGLLLLSLNRPSKDCIIRVFDIQGRMVYEETAASGKSEFQIDLRRQTPGLYLLELANGHQWIREKVIRY